MKWRMELRLGYVGERFIERFSERCEHCRTLKVNQRVPGGWRF